jgi:hypothetical protein
MGQPQMIFNKVPPNDDCAHRFHTGVGVSSGLVRHPMSYVPRVKRGGLSPPSLISSPIGTLTQHSLAVLKFEIAVGHRFVFVVSDSLCSLFPSTFNSQVHTSLTV